MAAKTKPAAPAKAPVITLNVAGKPTEVELVYGNDAIFRLQSLPNGAPPITSKRAFYAACCWIWGMLPETLHTTFPAPEHIPSAVPDVRKLPDLLSAVGDAIQRSKLTGDGKNS